VRWRTIASAFMPATLLTGGTTLIIEPDVGRTATTRDCLHRRKAVYVDATSRTIRRRMIDGWWSFQLTRPTQQPVVRDTDLPHAVLGRGEVGSSRYDVEDSATIVGW